MCLFALRGESEGTVEGKKRSERTGWEKKEFERKNARGNRALGYRQLGGSRWGGKARKRGSLVLKKVAKVKTQSSTSQRFTKRGNRRQGRGNT